MIASLEAIDRSYRRTVRQILRVNHAGEYGAIRIYQAQIFIARLLDRNAIPFLEETLRHERRHLAAFRELMLPRGTRPCGAMPLWGLGGWALGCITALLGHNAIMVCTEAVERTVHAHLNKQLAWLGKSDVTLSDAIVAIRNEEMGHLEGAQSHQTRHSSVDETVDRFVAAMTAFLIWCSTYGALTRMKSNIA